TLTMIFKYLRGSIRLYTECYLSVNIGDKAVVCSCQTRLLGISGSSSLSTSRCSRAQSSRDNALAGLDSSQIISVAVPFLICSFLPQSPFRSYLLHFILVHGSSTFSQTWMVEVMAVLVL
ncbi:uncharacterized, partial [Tachysurus ichikawai]